MGHLDRTFADGATRAAMIVAKVATEAVAVIADDDEFFRMALSAVLTQQCRIDRVIQTGSYDEALEAIRAEEHVAIALFDLNMPGMDGPAVLHHVRETCPQVDKVAVVSASRSREDIIATLAARATKAGGTVTIISSDKDLMQLVGDGVDMLDPMKNKRIGLEEVFEKFGVAPNRVVDVQSLAGDSVDNVPGAPGIGLKTAALLIQEYGDLDTLLARAAEIKQPKRREALVENAEQIRISRRLVQLDGDMPLDVALETLELKDPEPETVMGFLNDMEFRTLTKRVAERLKIDAPVLDEAKGMHVEGAHDAAPVVQQSSFDHAGYECIRDRAALDRIFATHRPDAVMHLAAESHVDRSIDGPGDFIETNITGTFNMLEAARAYWTRAGKPEAFRFHHISTDEVFGTLGDTGKFTEETPYQPNSPYSASKAASDHLVRAWHETYGLPVVMTNCSNNYGPYHFPEKLIPVVILNALAGKPIPVYGKGENVRDWLFVEDHADALLLVVEKGALGRSYNIGGENEARNIDLVRIICGLLDEMRPDGAPHDRLITFVTDRPGHDLRYAIDPARIREELGWRPSVTLEEGLRRTVRWYLDNEAWWKPLQARAGVGQRLGVKA